VLPYRLALDAVQCLHPFPPCADALKETHVQRYLRPLMERIQKGEIDPSFVVTHRLPLEEAPRGYQMFRDKRDECIKVVLKP
jgi:threonine dehydrogenase-like Zn-dependent dehydrogenase